MLVAILGRRVRVSFSARFCRLIILGYLFIRGRGRARFSAIGAGILFHSVNAGFSRSLGRSTRAGHSPRC